MVHIGGGLCLTVAHIVVIPGGDECNQWKSDNTLNTNFIKANRIGRKMLVCGMDGSMYDAECVKKDGIFRSRAHEA